MKICDKLRKLQRKYEGYIATRKLFGFTSLYMKTMRKLKEREQDNGA